MQDVYRQDEASSEEELSVSSDEEADSSSQLHQQHSIPKNTPTPPLGALHIISFNANNQMANIATNITKMVCNSGASIMAIQEHGITYRDASTVFRST